MKRTFSLFVLVVVFNNLWAQDPLLYFSDDTVATLKNEANHLFLQGKYEESINFYKRLILIDSLKKTSYYNIALNFSNIKEPDSARCYFNKALNLGYDSLTVYERILSMYEIKMENYEEAYNLISEMINYWPLNAQLYKNRASIWLSWKNESSGYISDMKKAAELGDKEAKEFVENYEKRMQIMRKKLRERGLD
ncbi:MAG: tetratricopeptide repeat protein [Prolixibacteraceae bacterium]|nr:tetratricopeptide repeat protein [Prolixibacteraceae bacterium]